MQYRQSICVQPRNWGSFFWMNFGRVNDSMTHVWLTHALSAVHMRSVCVTYDVQKQHGLIGPVSNGTLHVHLQWPPRARVRKVHETEGCPIPHFSNQKGARERPLCGRYAPSIRTSAEHALGRVRNRLLPDSQSAITSWNCRLKGRPARV